MPNNDPNCSVEKMRAAGRLVAEVLDHISDFVVPGVTSRQLDDECMRFIVEERGARPACLDVGFPGATCISVNHVVCKDGHHGDHSRMFHVGIPTRLESGWTLEPGMTFTVEPILNAGKRHIRNLPDGWTIVTKDHSLSSQWEHTVLVTDHLYEILTAAWSILRSAISRLRPPVSTPR